MGQKIRIVLTCGLFLLLLGLWAVSWWMWNTLDSMPSPVNQMEASLKENLPFHSFFRSLHSRVEILLGKTYVDGIYLQGDSLVEELPEPDQQVISQSLKALQSFCEPYRQKTYFMAVPTRSEFLNFSFVGYENAWSQRGFIKDLMERLNGYVTEIDLYAALTEADQEETYFKTETLWTGKGAYLGYEAFASRVGLYPKRLERYNMEIISHTFRGSLSRSLNYSAGGEDHIDLYYDPYLPDAVEVKKISNLGAQSSNSLYFREWLDTDQQQRIFLGEPVPLTFITSSVVNEKKLLLFGDDFSTVLAPYLLRNYSEVLLVDLSLLTADTAKQINPEDYDQILFVYSTKTLSQSMELQNLEMLLSR